MTPSPLRYRSRVNGRSYSRLAGGELHLKRIEAFSDGDAGRTTLEEAHVQQPIDRPTFLEDALAQSRFEPKAGFFQNATGRGIPLEHAGMQTIDVERRERMGAGGDHCLGGEAFAPVSLAQPVADFGDAPLDVAEALETDGPDGLAVEHDREAERRLSLILHASDPFCGVDRRVRVRKTVAEVPPNLAIVGVLDESRLVAAAPGPEQHPWALDLHGSMVEEISSGGRAMKFDTLCFGYGLIEGPREDGAGNLHFSDVTNGGVYRRSADGTITTVVPRRRGVGGIALHASGGLVISGKDVCHVREGETTPCS